MTGTTPDNIPVDLFRVLFEKSPGSLLIKTDAPRFTIVAASDAYALLATSVWVRAETNDVEMGDAVQLAKAFPAAQAEIAEFTGVSGHRG